jgi:microcystin-dependent protein
MRLFQFIPQIFLEDSMAEPFIGQIITTGFNYAPISYALCNGQPMSIAQNTALFSLIGTTYGGDGVQTFNLPDLRGRTSINQGSGPGLTNRVIGELGGTTTVTLLSSEMPAHSHSVLASGLPGTSLSPSGIYFSLDAGESASTYSSGTPTGNMNPQMLGLAGGNQPHNNMMPYLVISFAIALEGIFPSHS